MELCFIKADNHYVAEFKVEDDFNLHIETDGQSVVKLHQSSVEGTKYNKAHSLNSLYSETVIDVAVLVPVPPMWIKVTSATQPIAAFITSKGEVTDLNSEV